LLRGSHGAEGALNRPETERNLPFSLRCARVFACLLACLLPEKSQVSSTGTPPIPLPATLPCTPSPYCASFASRPPDAERTRSLTLSKRIKTEHPCSLPGLPPSFASLLPVRRKEESKVQGCSHKSNEHAAPQLASVKEINAALTLCGTAELRP